MYAYFSNSGQNIETQKKKTLVQLDEQASLLLFFFFRNRRLASNAKLFQTSAGVHHLDPCAPTGRQRRKRTRKGKKTASILVWVCAIAHRELVSGFSSHPSFIYICILNKKDGKNESMRVRSALFTDQSVSFARIFCQRLPFLSLSCTTTTTTTRERGKRRQECASAFIASAASPRNPNPASNPTSTYRNFRARKEE